MMSLCTCTAIVQHERLSSQTDMLLRISDFALPNLTEFGDGVYRLSTPKFTHKRFRAIFDSIPRAAAKSTLQAAG